MRVWALAAMVGGCTSLLLACSAGDGTGGAAPGAAGGDDAATSAPDGAAASATDGGDGGCVFTVDDAGVTHGCGKGATGPGDRDDGGDAGGPPPPDAALDASDLPFGASCWDGAQCASGLCFDYAVKGQFCTQRCTANADCPPQSLGCNGMGVCRVGN